MFESLFKKKEEVKPTPIPEGAREEAEKENALRGNISEMTENYDPNADRLEPGMVVEEEAADLELVSKAEDNLDQGTFVGEKKNRAA